MSSFNAIGEFGGEDPPPKIQIIQVQAYCITVGYSIEHHIVALDSSGALWRRVGHHGPWEQVDLPDELS